MQAGLEELGGLWVKLGQALALRFDILPADYCLQFFQLLNRLEPFSGHSVRAILERELRSPVEAVFRTFEWQPYAAASIGQSIAPSFRTALAWRSRFSGRRFESWFAPI
jgi:ubiquinone biosynthesis protein